MPNSNGSRRNLYFLSCVLFGCSKYVDLQTERGERKKRLFVGIYIYRSLFFFSSRWISTSDMYLFLYYGARVGTEEKKKGGQFRWIKIEAWSPRPGPKFFTKVDLFLSLRLMLLLTHRDANKRLNIDTDHSRRAVAVNSQELSFYQREAKVFSFVSLIFPCLSFWLRLS